MPDRVHISEDAFVLLSTRQEQRLSSTTPSAAAASPQTSGTLSPKSVLSGIARRHGLLSPLLPVLPVPSLTAPALLVSLAGHKILSPDELPFFDFESRGEVVIPGHGPNNTCVVLGIYTVSSL